MNYTVLLCKNKVIGYSHGYGSLEYSCLTTDRRDPTKSATKLAGGELTCGNLNCSHFSKSRNTYPAFTQQCSLHTAYNKLTVPI